MNHVEYVFLISIACIKQCKFDFHNMKFYNNIHFQKKKEKKVDSITLNQQLRQKKLNQNPLFIFENKNHAQMHDLKALKSKRKWISVSSFAKIKLKMTIF